MAYEIRYTDFVNKGAITVEDETVNTETSLSIPGRKRKDYGQVIGENFLQLLENFASPSAPQRPIEGQLWYDTTDGVDQLKVYDGTTWTASGGVKKSTNQPDVANSIVGDLWVNTSTQQLYLFSGSGWVLVGPSFSDGLLTGTENQTIVGTDDNTYTVLFIKIQDKIVAAISPSDFIPKASITGFPSGFKAGINLSSTPITQNQPFRYLGTSEKSENLVVSNVSVPASNFLRSDVESTTNHRLNIRNNAGIQIGENNQITLDITNEAGVIQHNISGSSIDFRLRNANRVYDVLRIDSSQRVGINTLAPEQDLQVSGNVLISPKIGQSSSGYLQISSTLESSSIETGSFITSGGAGIALNCNVGGNLQVSGSTQTANIVPDVSGARNIGTSARKYNQIHSVNFIGNLQGDVVGSLTGRSSRADRLTSSTTFAITGDVENASFAFDGQTGGTTKTFNVQISDGFISNKTRTFDAGQSDEILIKNAQGLRKISKQNFLKTVPLNPPGMVVVYAGATSPIGWLLCDGREISKTDYPLLWEAIGHTFKDPSLLGDLGLNTFAVPDLRGRFPLGLDNMGGTSANRVTDVAADVLGDTEGNQSSSIAVNNLPEHTHDMRGNDGSQYYGIREESTIFPADAVTLGIESGAGGTQGLGNSGGINTTGSLGEPVNVMNPYISMNYIIYTGQ